jgi:hypothetical protein
VDLVRILRDEYKLELTALPFGPDERAVRMADGNGENFDCIVRAAKLENTSSPVQRAALNVEKALGSLEGVCTRLRKSWWTYEWCHKRGISQFHQEPSGEVTANWSLGVYSKPVGDTIHSFQNGQHCEETNTGRSTEVTFGCCADEANSGKKAVLLSVEEPETCKYSAQVCTPALCTPNAIQDQSIPQLLTPLKGKCFTKHEGWWSYEFCVGKHVRQYHADQVQQTDGRKKTVVQAEYFLGMSMGGAAGQGNKNQQQRSKDSKRGTKQESGELVAVAEDPSMSRFITEFRNGTLCSESSSRREITIKMKCGTADTFVSVQEDRTCHYNLEFTTQRLCGHPAFKQKAIVRQEVLIKAAGGG